MEKVTCAERLRVIRNHLIYRRSTEKSHRECGRKAGSILAFSNTSTEDNVCNQLRAELAQMGVSDIEIEPPPKGMEEEYTTLLTPEALRFVSELVKHFNDKVDMMLKERIRRKVELDMTGKLPSFSKDPKEKHVSHDLYHNHAACAYGSHYLATDCSVCDECGMRRHMIRTLKQRLSLI